MYLIGLTLFNLHYLPHLMQKGVEIREKKLERRRKGLGGSIEETREDHGAAN